MLIPLGSEQDTVRRLPWVTFSIMGLCVLAYLLMLTADSGEARIANREKAALEYYFDHAYLELDERLQGFTYFSMRQQHDEPPPPPQEQQLRAEQTELDTLVAEVFAARDEVPFFKWGLVPARIEVVPVLSHMFMHAGLLHLLGNLFILYLIGPFVEDVWGRPLFAGFYLVSGCLAGLFFCVMHPRLDEPVVGASGAIAAVMGAFLVRFWYSKIKFFYFFFYFKVYSGTFSAPAWVVLPLWFLREVLNAHGLWAFFPDAAGANVGYWAHVGGFACGVVAAVAVKVTRFEERFVHRAVERESVVVDNTAVERALQAADEGRVDEAMAGLSAELRRSPDNADAAIALWNLAVAQRRAPEVAPMVLRSLRRAARGGDTELVATYWPEVLQEAPESVLDTATAVRFAEILYDGGAVAEATRTVQWLTPAVTLAAGAPVLVRLARLAETLNLPEAEAVVRLARQHPDLDAHAAAELDRLAPVAAAAAPPPAAAEPVQPLEVFEARPVALAADALRLEVAGSTRRLALDQVGAVGAAAIGPPGQRPVLVVDLVLVPAGAGSAPRVVRLRSTGFDPRRLVGGDDAMAALQRFLDQLLTLTAARPLPDERSARCSPYRRFASFEEWEQVIRAAVTP